MTHPVRLEAVPTRASDLVEAEWKPVRAELGITAFGVNGYVARAAGDVVIEDHSEGGSGYQELYVVTAGSVDFTVEDAHGRDQTFVMEAGTMIYVPADRGRTARARAAGAAVLVVGGVPGEAFAVSDWERRRLE
jgi:hypothetical protein